MTDRSKAVLLITGAKTIVFSPADVEGFVAAIRPSSAQISPANLPKPARPLLPILGVGVIAVVILGMTFLYAPGAPGITLTNTALTIHDRFYPVTLKASDVDLPNIRIVDLDTASDWRPTLRTNGFANMHYRSDWFRVGSGKTVRLYTAGSRRLVLLPPKANGSPVLFEAKDPQKLIEAIEREWREDLSQARITPQTGASQSSPACAATAFSMIAAIAGG